MTPRRVLVLVGAVFLAWVLLLVSAYVVVGLVRGTDVVAGLRSFAKIEFRLRFDAALLERARFGDAIHVGDLADPDLDEASGLAASARRDDLLWLINDSGSGPRLFATGLDGAQRGSFRLPEGTIWDWEDLASFRLDGRPFLLIGDTGDNLAWSRTRRLLFVEEPELRADPLDVDTPLPVAWSYEFRYEDGPRDCEAIAIDAEHSRVLLLSKATVPLKLYTLPLRPPGNPREVLVAREWASIPGIPQPTLADYWRMSWRAYFMSMATAMDISSDGRLAAVLTYDSAYLFERTDPQESWSSAFARAPRVLPFPQLRQAEALGFGPGGVSLFVTSEYRPAPMYRLDPGDTRALD